MSQKLIGINNEEDVKKLFEKGNFLYSIIREYPYMLINKHSCTQDPLKLNLKLERDYQKENFDWIIHNEKYARDFYCWSKMPIIEPANTPHPNDMLTSATHVLKKDSGNFLKKDTINAFLSVNHTIGNMITAIENWIPGGSYKNKPVTNDNIFHKLISINNYWENPKLELSDNNKTICSEYKKICDGNINYFVENFYFHDCFIYKNGKYYLKEDLVEFGNDKWKRWNRDHWNCWINNISKVIIQRGYRMQLKYKNPKFSPNQRKELDLIFDYFKITNNNINSIT